MGREVEASLDVSIALVRKWIWIGVAFLHTPEGGREGTLKADAPLPVRAHTTLLSLTLLLSHISPLSRNHSRETRIPECSVFPAEVAD